MAAPEHASQLTSINQGLKITCLLMISLLFVSITYSTVSAGCTGSVSEDVHGGSGYDFDDGIDVPYIDNGNGTVTDQGTDLMWQKSDDGAVTLGILQAGMLLTVRLLN